MDSLDTIKLQPVLPTKAGNAEWFGNINMEDAYLHFVIGIIQMEDSLHIYMSNSFYFGLKFADALGSL